MLGQWSFWRVAAVSAAWVVACVLATLAWVLFPAWSAYNRSAGSGGIGAVSFGINVFMLAIPVGPPILLFVAWLMTRWR